MSGIWTEDDLRSTIPFEEIEVVESDTDPPDDLLDDLSQESEPIGDLEPTVARLPYELAEEKETRARPNWDLTPPLSAVRRRVPRRTKVHDEVTAVRENPMSNREESYWVDVHAVVDEEGRLVLPKRVARRLQEGGVVELRVARWAVEDG